MPSGLDDLLSSWETEKTFTVSIRKGLALVFRSEDDFIELQMRDNDAETWYGILDKGLDAFGNQMWAVPDHVNWMPAETNDAVKEVMLLCRKMELSLLKVEYTDYSGEEPVTKEEKWTALDFLKLARQKAPAFALVRNTWTRGAYSSILTSEVKRIQELEKKFPTERSLMSTSTSESVSSENTQEGGQEKSGKTQETSQQSEELT